MTDNRAALAAVPAMTPAELEVNYTLATDAGDTELAAAIERAWNGSPYATDYAPGTLPDTRLSDEAYADHLGRIMAEVATSGVLFGDNDRPPATWQVGDLVDAYAGHLWDCQLMGEDHKRELEAVRRLMIWLGFDESVIYDAERVADLPDNAE